MARFRNSNIKYGCLHFLLRFDLSRLYCPAGSSCGLVEVPPWQIQVIIFQGGSLCIKQAFPIVAPEKALTEIGSHLVQFGLLTHLQTVPGLTRLEVHILLYSWRQGQDIGTDGLIPTRTTLSQSREIIGHYKNERTGARQGEVTFPLEIGA